MKNFQNCVEKLIATSIVPRSGDLIALMHDGKVYFTKPDVDFAKITDESVFSAEVTDNAAAISAKYGELYGAVFALFAGKKPVGAAIVTHPEYSAACANSGRDVPPVLDDMAQIVGPSLRFAKSPALIAKKLKGRCCLLLAGGGLLATGRTSTEAVTATLVAEKSCRCYVKAAHVGGAKKISALEALLMHVVYTLKYSKKNIENQKESE